jgi:LemA protein
VAESYPGLKADHAFSRLQNELVETENRIQAARRFYNGNVRDYRNKVESFPGSLVAAAFGFGSVEFLEFDPEISRLSDIRLP